MKKIKNLFDKYFNVGFMLTLLVMMFGVSSNVALAEGGAGSADGANRESGIDTLGGEEEIADPEWIQKHIESEITKISPMSTPFLQLSNYASKGAASAQVVKYYSMGTRPLKTTLATGHAITAATGATDRVELVPTTTGIFSVDDTILVVGVNGYKADGTTVDSGRDLVLSVCSINENTGNISVYAVNGMKKGNSENIYWPAIEAGTTLVRMGKACAEKDVQTDRYFGLPDAEEQYCQNFMIQVEASTFSQMTKKEANWGFSDIEEQAVADMKITQEMSFLFGAKGVHKHRGKKGDQVYFTGGVWYMAGKQTDVGTYASGQTTIKDTQLVDMLRFLYANTGIGGKEKVVLAGSQFLAALAKIDSSSKIIQRQSATKWQLEFSGFKSNFGSILVVLDEQLDLAGKSDWAFATDPDYLKKRTFKSWSRSVYDMRELAIRNTDAVVIQEVCCLFLTHKAAHARLHLAGSTPIDQLDVTGGNGILTTVNTNVPTYSDGGHGAPNGTVTNNS